MALRYTNEFFLLLPKLEIKEFMGILSILGVKSLDENGDIKQFTDVIQESVKNFEKKNRKFRKDLIKIMKQAVKEDKHES